MTSRHYVAAALRFAGSVLCAFAVWAFTGLHFAGAAPASVREFLQLPLAIAPVAVLPPQADPDQTPEPEPTYTATPTPKLSLRRGGPLEFSLTGSLNVGNRTPKRSARMPPD